MKKITTEEFINRARKVHGNKYGYSKVEYKNAHTKVCIICPIHGEFWQIPNDHLNGCGCPKCKIDKITLLKKGTTNTFIEKAKKVHGDKYDYSKVNYINAKTKICIICPVHGEFWQTPNKHLNGEGCRKCGIQNQSNSKKYTKKDFIERARKVHGNKYDYSKVEYINNKTKVCIVCPEHGEFWQTPNAHLQGQGCYKCFRHVYDNKSFICESRKIHGNKYDYSKVAYKSLHNKVCIICPEHGEFWQEPSSHIHLKCGCPSCSQSHLENDTYSFLKNEEIIFEQQKKFNWLGLMRLDFYLPEYNIAIECQGIQHYQPIEFFGGKKAYNDLIRRDKIKKQLCEEHNIKMIYVDNSTDFNELKLR